MSRNDAPSGGRTRLADVAAAAGVSAMTRLARAARASPPASRDPGAHPGEGQRAGLPAERQRAFARVQAQRDRGGRRAHPLVFGLCRHPAGTVGRAARRRLRTDARATAATTCAGSGRWSRAFIARGVDALVLTGVEHDPATCDTGGCARTSDRRDLGHRPRAARHLRRLLQPGCGQGGRRDPGRCRQAPLGLHRQRPGAPLAQADGRLPARRPGSRAATSGCRARRERHDHRPGAGRSQASLPRRSPHRRRLLRQRPAGLRAAAGCPGSGPAGARGTGGGRLRRLRHRVDRRLRR